MPDGVCYPEAAWFDGYDVNISGHADRADTWILTTPDTGLEPPNVDPDERLTVNVEPYEVPADGETTGSVTATVSRNGVGLAGYGVTFSTDGDVTFSPTTGTTDDQGRVTVKVTASTTPGIETITARSVRSVTDYYYTYMYPPPAGSAKLSERGMRLTLDPVSIPADGSSTSVATATVFQAGLVDEEVCFSTDGDVGFDAPGPDHCGRKTGPNTWVATITASNTPAVETITATGTVSGLRASVELAEGGGQWFKRTSPAGPNPGRENAAMAYDEANQVTVLFGGYYGKSRDTTPLEPAKVLSDTWIWDGTRWSQATTANGEPIPGPSAREGAAMAYDASSGQLLLFGGHDGTDYLGDTWTFDTRTKTWTKRDVPGPSKRYVANMASDGTGVVLFAGTAGWAYDVPNGPTDPNGPGRLHDTWTWRNGAWTEEHPERTPPPPAGSQVAQFDNDNPVVVPLPPPPPGCPGSKCPADQADPYPSPILVSGLSGKVANVTVTLRGLAYRGEAGGGANDLDIMLVAPDGKAVMVMSDACGDADLGPVDLRFDDSAAARLSPDSACPAGSYRPTDVETREDTPFHSADAFSAPAPPGAGSSSLSDLRGADPNGAWSLYVVDDGPNDIDPTAEAGRIANGWAIDIETTESEISPPRPLSVPPGRGRAAMAFHPPSGKVVLYGGTQEYQASLTQTGVATTRGLPFRPLGDTWTWDVNTKTWSQHGTGTHPGARRSATMALHASSGNLVLFGGSPSEVGRVGDPAGCPSTPATPECPYPDTWSTDTWTWDGAGWGRQSPPVSPPGSYLAGMAASPGGHLVVVGGLGETGATWTWEAKVSLTLSTSVVPADGTAKAVATARVVDAEGRGVPDLAVRFSTDGDVRISEITDAGDGNYTATITASESDSVETITVRTPLGSASATLEEVAQRCTPEPVRSTPGTWSGDGEVADMLTPRAGLATASGGDGRIYTFGGGQSETDETSYETASAVEAYDPCTNSWNALPPLPGGARYLAAAASGPDGRIYVVGGKRPGAWVSMDLVEVYTPGSGSTPGRWETLPPLPTPRSALGVAVDEKGSVFVAGGLLSSDGGLGQAVDSFDVYSPVTGTWTPGTPMPKARWAHGTAGGPDGEILVFGGASAAAGPVDNEAVAYDPEAGTWRTVAPMSAPRGVFGSAAGPDGAIYASGGVSGAGAGGAGNEAVEAYVECAGGWVPVTPMHYGRWGHGFGALVTGSDGRIYSMGGRASAAVAEDPGSLGQLMGNGMPGGGRTALVARVEAYTPTPDTTALCPRASINDVIVQEDVVSSTVARFTVTLDRPPATTTDIGFRTASGSALAGSDYLTTSGTLTFGAGEATKTIDVSVLGDAAREADETFTVELSAIPTLAGLAKATGTATIVDAPLPQLSAGSATVGETFGGTVPAVFAVTLSEAARTPVSVDYATADGSARAGADYTATTGRLEIPVGATSASITVPVLGDTLAETTEEFSVALANPSGAELAQGRGTGTILDAVGGLSVGDVSVTEDDSGTSPSVFTVTLSGPATEAVTVDYATSDGSATAGSDYVAVSGTLRFEAGEQSKTVVVEVIGDTGVEDTERFTLALANAQGAPLARAMGTATVADNDVAPIDDERRVDDGPGPQPQPQPVSAPSASSSPSGPPAPAALVPGAALAAVTPAISPTEPQPPSVIPPALPQAIPNPLTQAQAQAQQQAQQQTQQQAQQQAQQQLQQQAQAQAQAQASAQVGMMSERQREVQVEQAHATSRDSSAQVNLASDRRRSRPSPAPILAFIAALMATGLSLLSRQERSPAPQCQQAIPQRRSQPQRRRPLH